MQQRHGLGEVDDVDVVAGTENVIRHFRIPAVRLVAKVNASFKQLTHRKIGKRHSSVLRLVPPETCEQTSLLGPVATGRPFEPCFRVRWRVYSGIFARSKEIGAVLRVLCCVLAQRLWVVSAGATQVTVAFAPPPSATGEPIGKSATAQSSVRASPVPFQHFGTFGG